MLGHRKNIYSQNGEDGVIEHLFEKIGVPDGGTCCEFGSWDGKHLSNTFRLVKERGFKALYIEGDAEKYKQLLKTCEEHPSITPVCEYVKILDDIFERTEFPLDIDLLSIDIDSTDYEVWKAVQKVNPKVVIIEPDNSIPEWVDTPMYPTGPNGGANTAILKALAREKGYTFACNTGNLFFVRNDLAHLVEPDERAFPWWLDGKFKSLIIQAKADESQFLPIVEPQYHDNLKKAIENYAGGVRLGYMSV
jgi:hypothetical protein